MERGNTKHSPREDDMLAAELSGTLGPGGSNREEWVGTGTGRKVPAAP